MTVAEWILVAFLSVALLVFLVIFIVLLVKLIGFTNDARKIVQKGQSIADKADDIVGNVRGLTSVGGIVSSFTERYLNNHKRRQASNSSYHEASTKSDQQSRSHRRSSKQK